jgi:hypothetical protein
VVVDSARWFKCSRPITRDAGDLAVLPCFDDKPDLYFWLEYQIGASGRRCITPLLCYTYWDYACGTEVILHVTDPALRRAIPSPICPASRWRCRSGTTSVSARSRGLVLPDIRRTYDSGELFGGRLEPHVWFAATL